MCSLDGLERITLVGLPKTPHSQKNSEKRKKPWWRKDGGREASGSELVAGRVSPILHASIRLSSLFFGRSLPICHPIGLSPQSGGTGLMEWVGFAVSPGYELWLCKLVPCSELLLPL